MVLVKCGDVAGGEDRTGGRGGRTERGGGAVEEVGILESDGMAIREDILEETAGEEWVEVSGSQKPSSGECVAADEEGTLTRPPALG